VLNDGIIDVYANADNMPKDYAFKRVLYGYHGAAGWANGIQTGSGDDTIVLGENSMITGQGRGHTVSASGQAQAWVFGVNAGDGLNTVNNSGTINMNAEAVADVFVYNLLFDIAMQAVANAGVTGISTGAHADMIENFGDITVTSTANASTAVTPDDSWGQTAVSTAYGINAGDGNNVVENYGTINVSASALAGAGSAGGGSAAATAIGIKTGNGDDTILNAGIINTSYLRFQAPSSLWSGSGVAIDSGGGNDTVSLLGGTSLSGSVTLGHGDDTLVLAGSPVVSNGLIYAGTYGSPTSGYDIATFYGSGTFDAGLLSGFDKGLKTGIGTYTVPELPISVIEVIEGTLLIDNDYSFSPKGKYTAHIYPDGNCGVLQVNGTAALSGDLDVVADHGVYLDGTEYGVLASEKVDGAFKSMNLPGSAILTFEAEQDVDGTDIEVDVASFTTVADNATEEAIGEYLDRLTPIASGELCDVIAEFQWLLESEFDRAFASVSPKQYGASSKKYIRTTRKSFDALQDRLYRIRKSVAFAPVVNGMDATGNLAGFTGVSSKSCGFWHKGIIESFYEEGSGVTRPLLDTGNFNSFGYDTTYGKNLVAGFGRDHAEVTTTSELIDGDGVVSGFKHFAYGSYLQDEIYMDVAFFYGNEAYNHERDITIGTLEGSTASEHASESFSYYIETGKLLTSGSSILQPFCSLEYIYFKEEGFTESGGGPLALKIEDKERDMLISNLGISAAKMWAVNQWTMIPEISLAWRYYFEPADYSSTASFVSAPGEHFVIDGKEDSTHALAIGASLDIANYGKFRSLLDFSSELFTDENIYDLEWKLEYNF
jgi:hypothetical protein